MAQEIRVGDDVVFWLDVADADVKGKVVSIVGVHGGVAQVVFFNPIRNNHEWRLYPKSHLRHQIAELNKQTGNGN